MPAPQPIACRHSLYCVLFMVLAMAGGWGALVQEAWAADAPVERVTLQLKWYHQFQFAGFYAAIEKGYYREAGLEVILKEADPRIQPAELVDTGNADYAIDSSGILVHRSQGLKIVAIGAIFQHSPAAVMALKSSGIQSPQDLRGRRLMDSLATDIEVVAMLANEGVRPDQVTILPHTWNLDDLVTGKTDALAVYVTNEPYLMQQRDIEINLLRPLNYAIDFYGDCLITSEAEARQRPDRVQAFMRATRRGWTYAMAHKEEMADLILSRYSTAKTRDQLLFEAAAMDKLILPELVEIGHMNPYRWRHIADQYAAAGLLPRNYSLKGFLFTPPESFGASQMRKIWIGIAAMAGVMLLTVGVLVTFNYRLKQAVLKKTAALREHEQRLREVAEVARAANDAKDQFLATLSHELRTPLTPVLALLSSLDGDQRLPPQALKDVAMMRRNVDLEARLIDDLLDLTRITHGRLTLHRRSVDLHEVVCQAWQISEFDASAKHQRVHLDLRAALHHVQGDPARLQQVFWNVIKNAIRYTPAGGEIAIHSENVEAAAGSPARIVVSVSDTGVGIVPEMLPRVFNAFAEAPAAESRHIRGLGLGLTIARSVIQLHGGRITAASDGPGQGATFTITLPAAAEEHLQIPAAVSPPPPVVHCQRILLVEDHLATLAVLSQLLTQMGHHVLKASTVAAAVELGLSNEFDLLVSDVGLPDGTGLDLISRLRTAKIFRAIAISGYGMESDLQQSRDAGFAAHLVKPVDINRLRQIIEDVCGDAAAVEPAHDQGV